MFLEVKQPRVLVGLTYKNMNLYRVALIIFRETASKYPFFTDCFCIHVSYLLLKGKKKLSPLSELLIHEEV